MVSHSTEQQYDLIRKPESVFILLCSSWRSTQSPHVPFEFNGFNSSPSPPDQGFAKQKGSSKVWKEKGSKWFSHFFSLSPSSFCFCIACVFCFLVLSQSSLCFVLLNMFLFVYFLVLLYFVFHKIKWKIRKIQKQCVFVYIGTCVPWMAIEIKFSKLCIFCNLDEYFYAQLSMWALWLVFLMSKIK